MNSIKISKNTKDSLERWESITEKCIGITRHKLKIPSWKNSVRRVFKSREEILIDGEPEYVW